MVRAAVELPTLRLIPCKLFFDRFGNPGVSRDVARPSDAGRVDSLEGFGWKPEVDPVQGANRRSFRIRQHGATLAPPRFVVYTNVAVLFWRDMSPKLVRKGRCRCDGEPTITLSRSTRSSTSIVWRSC